MCNSFIIDSKTLVPLTAYAAAKLSTSPTLVVLMASQYSTVELFLPKIQPLDF
jgi:hypothetical protein